MVHDFAISADERIGVERRVSHEHFIKENSDRPPITLLSINATAIRTMTLRKYEKCLIIQVAETAFMQISFFLRQSFIRKFLSLFPALSQPSLFTRRTFVSS